MEDLFFYSAKLIWKVLSPDTLFLILLLTSLILLFLNHRFHGLLLLSFLSLFLVTLAFFPLGNWLLYPLEKQFQHNPSLPQRIDGIIVLGGSVIPNLSQEWQQLQTNDHHERISSFLHLAREYPSAKLVFTGGNASINRQKPSEASIISQYFQQVGIEPERLLIEDQARNTAENVSFSKQLVQPQDNENWILVTTAYHMPRSVDIFCEHNWPVIPYPVDHRTVPSELYKPQMNLVLHANTLVDATHEWLGLLAYYLTGKTQDLLPGPCR